MKKLRKRISTFLKTKKYIFEPMLISLVTISLLSIGWAYALQEAGRYINSAIETYSGGQEVLLRQVSKDVQASLNAAKEQQGLDYVGEEEAVKIVTEAEATGSRYWFLYSSKEVIFEKNPEETNILKGKSIKELVEQWKIKGGDNIESFENMLDYGTNGTVVFTKDSKVGKEVVSFDTFTVGGIKYYVGISTLRAYILSTAKVNEHILYLRIFSIVASINILLFSLLLIVRIYKSHKESEGLKGDIVEKNVQIKELSNKLASKTEAVQNISVYDSLTGLYNKKFFESLLMRVNYNKIKPVSTVIIDINGLEYLNTKIGYEAGDELLRKTAELIKKTCIDSDVIARTGNSEFSILMTDTDEDQAYGAAENINRKFMNMENEGLSLSIGVSQMPEYETHIQLTIQDSRKNMIFAKMLDKNSSSSSIIAMLMETLSAFSKEAVDHCERLKTMALNFGKHLGLSPSEVNKLAVAAQLHDVGKIGIPDNILNKPEALTEQERELVKRHSEIGYNILNAIPFLNDAAIDVLEHHEHYDGSGYPNGLKGNEIGFNGRIINIIDSFDIMTHYRAYSKTMTAEEAMLDIKAKSGKQYDPYLVEEFNKCIVEKILASREEERETG